MRISDWSSDVCSSDLQEIDDLVLVQRRAELGGGHRLLLDVLDEALAVLGAVLLRGLHDQAAHFLLRHLDAVGLPDLGEQQPQPPAALGNGMLFVTLCLHLSQRSLGIFLVARLMPELCPISEERRLVKKWVRTGSY